MFKKIYYLLILNLVVVLVLAACGQAETPAEEPAADTTVTETEAEPAEEEAMAEEEAEPAEEEAMAEEEAASDTLCGLGTGEAATGEPIKVGALVGATGPDDWSSSAQSAAAYFACVNANGGINGRPINYIVEDDAWDPEQASQVAAKLVNDDQVVAMVGTSSFVECAANAQLYENENVISITGVGVPRECFESKNIAPTNQGPRLSNLGMAQYAYETYGATKFTCMGPNIPNVGVWGCEGIADWGEDKGVTVDIVVFDPATADPTSLVLEAISSEPDAITVATPVGVAIPIFGAAEEQDLRDKYHWMGPTTLYERDFPEAVGSYWDGYIDAQIEFVNLDSDSPDNQAWLQIMDEYGDPDDPRDSFSQSGFLAAKIFTAALLDLDPDSLDRDTVSEALRGIKNFRSDLICGPYYFGANSDRHSPNHAGRIVHLVDGAWQLAADCFESDDPDLAPILEMEVEEGLVN